MISKYVSNIEEEIVDNVFIKLKITENTTITKELISEIILELKQ